MAKMIPTDSYFDPASGEREMFEALKQLSDDYYVFHSYRLVQLIPDKGLNENEIDFLVFNPNYGCLFIECKNSRIERLENGSWNYIRFDNGVEKRIPMKDPFNQAFTGQHNLFNKLRDTYPEYRDIINKCKFMVGVWLPKYTKDELNLLNLGPNITKEVILTREALLYPNETKKQIQYLMERMNKVHLVCKYEEELIIDSSPGYKHALSHSDAMFFYNKVLCPTFRTVINIKKNFEETYIELLEEQYVILDFLSHQRTAAISGASGTGKTLVALERARRLSDKGEKVLFLCYNRNLMDWLEYNYKKDLKNVDFLTLDAYGCKTLSVPLNKLSYHDLNDFVIEQMFNKSFPYKHIIVDEGQDFGKELINDSHILDIFAEYGEGEYDNEDTSFFIFYDKNQLVNSKQLPSYLQNVDSKLTLYKNCRNTKNIANTAYSLLEMKPILYDRCWIGEVPCFYSFDGEDEFVSRLDKLLDDLAKKDSSERVIITCAESLSKSIIGTKIIEEKGNKAYIYKNSSGKRTKVYTCPTFKGLETDNVILIDVSNSIFDKDNKTFYVSATRAKKELYIFIDRNKLQVEKILNSRFKESFPSSNKIKQLTLAMHGILK